LGWALSWSPIIQGADLLSLQAFLARHVITPEGIRPAAILVEEERIQAVISPDQVSDRYKIHDFGEAAILPGLVDSHVHINDPGRAEWEGFETATRAGAAGGCTLLVDMPLNCLPATTSVAALQAKRAAAQGRCRVDWAAWGGVVHDTQIKDNQSDLEALAAEGVPGFKCFLINPGIDGFTMVTEHQLRLALPHVARTGLPLLVHAELPSAIDRATNALTNADWSRYSTYLQSRPDQAELDAIRLLLSLCREYSFRLHIVHLSTSRALPELCAARAEGLGVSVETCPHYLHLTAETIPDRATLTKCAPPIRSRENGERLWQGLRDGTIDMVVTDHSPCPPAMKRLSEGNFQTAWGGIASLSVALPLMWTEASRRGFTLLDLAQWMAEAPARLAGCARKGRIAAGYDADFVIFDADHKFVLTKDKLYYRHPVSPYLGETLRGVVKATYLRGNCVFREGEFPGEPAGREHTAAPHRPSMP
jgi:allantoinase